jgi:hypothetical protein
MCCMTRVPWCVPSWGWLMVHELEVDTSSTTASAFTGTGGASGATVEYLVDQGATSPSVSVNIAAGGLTTAWTDTAIAPGFHFHQFGPLPHGAKLTLTASNAIARLRWCEPVCC